jgi:hypothetical protein
LVLIRESPQRAWHTIGKPLLALTATENPFFLWGVALLALTNSIVCHN